MSINQLADASMKKSQSIKSLNTRLQKFAIEDVEIPKIRKDRSNSVMNDFPSRPQIQPTNQTDQILQKNSVYSIHDQEGYEVFPSQNLKKEQQEADATFHQNQLLDQQQKTQKQQQANKVKEEYVKLISKDGKEFVVPVRILKHSPTFARMLGSSFNESKLVFSQ